MDIQKVLEGLDLLFKEHKIDEIESYLLEALQTAETEADAGCEITILNELIGFYRDSSQFFKAITACETVLALMKQLGLEESIPYATTLLNVANAYRAAGKLEESKSYYESVEEIYKGELAPNDFRFASLNNNLSLLYQEMQDFEKACECLEKALEIALCYEDAKMEVATTYANLATSLLKLGKQKEAALNLQKALSIFEADEEKDFHYSAALSAMGEVKYLEGDFEAAAEYYRRALDEIAINMGKESQAYAVVAHNLNATLDQLQKKNELQRAGVFENGLALCEAFYREYGAPMIHEKFGAYESMIAVGLVGQGSECFGFDDEVSRDHDFGPGFCIWLTDAVYDEIGEKLQIEYDKLPKSYMGIHRLDMPQAGKRVGVFRIHEFYEALIGMEEGPESENDWLFLEDYQLATATNGKVFVDELGEFSRIREKLLAYYPESVRVKKIARQAALIAQSGQYNYFRMLGRNDFVAASLSLQEFVKSTMSMVYLLNSKYAPFYKWMHRGMRQLLVLQKVSVYLEKLVMLSPGDMEIEILIERIVELILEQLKRQNLTHSDDTYLEHHTRQILGSIVDKEREFIDSHTKEELVDMVVKLEWEAFDQVKNAGGRADCQDNWGVFSVMRKSQFLTWPKELIFSYLADFVEANEKGWNMITEKYGRMEASTCPEEYEKIKDKMPQISAKKAVIVDEIVKLQVGFMEEFAREYPKACQNMRSIHTWEDTRYNTSYETYLRGELLTYTDETLRMYGEFVVDLYRNNQNLAKLTVTNTALLYGYKSLDDMENRL